MNYEVVNLAEKTVVGLCARARNDDPECGKIIGGLWQKMMTENLAETIKNKANNYVIGLYSDYDFKDMSYDVTVGVEVTKAEDDLTTKVVPGGKFAMFKIKGDVVKDVGAAWNEIWKLPLERSFTGDFEEYISNVDGVGEINIYVALK